MHGVEVVADVAGVRHRADQAKCSVSLARRVCSSLMRMPGTVVAIGLYGPRISAGAFGLQVPGVEVARPAAQQDEDARLLGRALGRIAPADAGRNEAGRSKTECAGLKKPSPSEESAHA